MRLGRLGFAIWTLLACTHVAFASPVVDRVKQADEEGRYADVLREVDTTDTTTLSVEERVTLLRLEASAHAAFGHEDAAVLAFRKLLALQPDFALSPDASPKLRRYLETARKPALPAPRVVDTPPPVGGLHTDVPAPASRPWYRSGWTWGAVGVVAATSIAIVVWRGTSDNTSPNLGEIPLP